MPNCIYYLIREVHANLLQNMGRNLPKIYLKKYISNFLYKPKKNYLNMKLQNYGMGGGHFYLSLTNLIENCTLHNAYVIIYKLQINKLNKWFRPRWFHSLQTVLVLITWPEQNIFIKYSDTQKKCISFCSFLLNTVKTKIISFYLKFLSSFF